MGQPFLVNSYQSNWQRNPVILPQKDGGFLVVWDSYLNNFDDGPSATVLSGQLYNANGNPVGGEILIAGFDGTSQAHPEMTRLPDGGFVLTWIYDDYDDILTLDTEVWATVYNANGSVRRAAFRVDTVASNEAVSPVVTATGDGGFVISFGIESSATNLDQVYARAYTAAGIAKGANFLVNPVVQKFDQIVSRSATTDDGRTVIIWKSESTIPNGHAGQSDIRATILKPDGTILRADFRLAPSTGSVTASYNYGYDVAGREGGGFAMVQTQWASDFYNDDDRRGVCITLTFFNSSGNAVSAPRLVHQTDNVTRDVRVTQLETGEYVAVWWQHSETPGQVGDDTYGRVFSASGQALGPIFQIGVNVDRYNTQEEIEIEALAGGGFIVVYTDDFIDNDDEGIAGQIFGRGTGGADQLGVDRTGTMAGLAGNDRLTGDGRANRLDGGTGNDLLRDTAGGNDSLSGGFGNDTLQGGRGNDLIEGGAGGDTAMFVSSSSIRVDLQRSTAQATGEGLDILRGIEHVTSGAGSDVLAGNAASNRLSGNGGNDRLIGRLGHDVLDGGLGNDLLQGGLGIDTAVYQGSAGVRVNLGYGGAQVTGQGTDRLEGIENLITGLGADRLVGSAQRNVLNGGGGSDTLMGQGGNDLLIGASGNDFLTGGAGADSFHFAAGSGRDQILDFQLDIDVIRIDVANPAAPGVSVSAVSGGTLISWGSDSVILRNIAPRQLDADDLIFI